MTLRHPGPAQKVPKNHLEYAPRPTTLADRNRPELYGHAALDAPSRTAPEQSSVWRAVGETSTESQIIKVTVR